MLNLRLIIEESALDCGCDPGFACDLARSMEERLRERYGGTRIYIPNGIRRDKRKRILEQFTGENRQEICQEFGISKATFYRILGGTHGRKRSMEERESERESECESEK